MTRDRTEEMKRIRNRNSQGYNEDEADGAGGGEPPSYQESVVIEMVALDGLSRFFKQVEDTRKLIDELKEDVAQVRKMHSKILSSPIPDDKAKQELDQLMSTIKTSSNVIRTKLKDIEKAVLKEEEDCDEDVVPASLRMRRNQHSALLRTFVEIINEYQLAQTDYRDRCKTRIKRQLEIAGSQFTDEEVENMIEEGHDGVFTQSIIQESAQAKQMLADINARHNDIIKLEKSIKELHEMFMEMAVLIENQGEIVDRIENHVTSTRDFVETAEEQLNQAQKSQSSARRKKFYIAIIIIIVILVVALIIYFT